MSSKRRRSSRPDPARFRLGSNLEALESRQLLTQSPYLSINNYPLTNFPTAKDPGRVPAAQISHPIGTDPAILATYQNEGKDLTGEDRQGNRWHLTLTGPGQIIVTDATPNDGVLDDDLNTITLVGTSATKSVLTGTVSVSFRNPTTNSQVTNLGQVYFNSLKALQGVKSITLNGFVLTDTVTPPGSAVTSPAETAINQTTGIQLLGGVGFLEFEGIDGRFPTPNPANTTTVTLPTTMTSDPISIVIGNPTTPLSIHPNIRIDHIYNTVYDNTAFSQDPSTGLISPGVIPTGPLTSPTISLVVNGSLASFDVVSISQQPDPSTLNPNVNEQIVTVPAQYIPTSGAALQYQFPIVGTTGRTAVQSTSVQHIRASAGVTNTTFSKSAQPFQSSLTGLDSVGTAQFGGTADAVAIDARGDIKGVKFAKGAGNPTGLSTNPIYYGTPAAKDGYAATKTAANPNGLVAVQVTTEGNIGSIVAAPSGQFLQTSQDPTKIQAGLNQTTVYVNHPGQAVTQSLISAGQSIGSTNIVGDLTNSEIKAGYNYSAAITGTEAVTAKSKVAPIKIRGNLVNSVVSASYRANDGVYGNGNDTAGDGTIKGARAGQIYAVAANTTVLGNHGSGFFARTKKIALHPAKKATP